LRALFIYWRTRATSADAAEDALRQWQAALRRESAQLEALLYRRAEDADEADKADKADRADAAPTLVTLMETYTGLDEALEQRIREEGDRLLAPWLDGVRHVEAFVRRR
jgi:hypothetical protein